MSNEIDCKYRMIAIGNVEHAGVQYVPGQQFCVETADTRQFLIDNSAARDYTADPDAGPAAPPPKVDTTPEPTKTPKARIWNRK